MRNLLILLSLIFVLPFITNAQALEGAGGVDTIISSGISILITPSVPGPNEQAEARLESSTVELDTSKITWSINGRVVDSGIGLKYLSFKTGDVGSQTRVSVRIDSNSGSFNKIVVLDTGSVDLIWQGEGYTPPFYKGKTLWANQAAITLMAIPSVGGNTQNTIYRWSINGKVLGNSSGVGKNSLTLIDSILGLPKVITVDIMSGQGQVLTTTSMRLSPILPRVLIYEDNPLYGLMFNREVTGSFSLNREEISFEAMPLFFGTMTKDASQMSYDWNVNGDNIGQKNSRVTFRVPSDTSGETLVGVLIKNANSVMQSARKAFAVQFDNQTNL